MTERERKHSNIGVSIHSRVVVIPIRLLVFRFKNLESRSELRVTFQVLDIAMPKLQLPRMYQSDFGESRILLFIIEKTLVLTAGNMLESGTHLEIFF